METPENRPSPPFRKTEYAAPILLILLMLAAGGWLFGRLRQRERPPAPPEPGLQGTLEVPRKGGQ